MALATDTQGRHSVSPDGRFLFDSDEDVDRGPDFAAIRGSAEFGALRRRFRRFVFPMTALFMGWYLAFVLLAAYDHPFMAIQVLGLINMGMVLGLAQFVSTVVIMLVYTRYARLRLDPAMEAVRASSGEHS
ncbi:MAG: hypothetical protein QOC83_233 [Pseudonocardiales bacterium]|jgi:uncharacterized membrane protein (DUF485 family)|nr:hypothetical protein [Pseudonocardiales bacterium]